MICFGQNVTIEGTVDTTYLSETNMIYAYTYDDFISYKEKAIAIAKFDFDPEKFKQAFPFAHLHLKDSTHWENRAAYEKITPKNYFKLTFSVSSPTWIYLMVDNAKAEMVVEPNKKYDIHFLKKDSDAVNTLSIPVPVEIEFNNSDSTELNYLMADFSNRYEAFLEYHRPLITKKSSSVFGKIDTMKTLCRERYSKYNNPYLNNYITYTFASLEESLSLKSEIKVFKNHILGKPIQLSNNDYMHFFDQFFSTTIKTFMNSENAQTEINKQSFSSLLEYERQLPNDTIREAFVLKMLAESQIHPEIKVNAVLTILDQASKQCKAEENQRSAVNLKKKLSAMNIGKPAPNFYFQDKNGKNVSLSDFKGKYVYVNFWTTWCSSCTQEMMLIPELKKLYGNKIVFVSISVDKKPEAMKNFLLKNPKLDWTFLYCDNYKKAKEEFNVLTVPTYFLIDPKGNVLKYPADKPQDIEPTFNQIKKKK